MRSQVAAVANEIAGQDGSIAMIFAEGNALQASAQAAASKHLGSYVGQEMRPWTGTDRMRQRGVALHHDASCSCQRWPQAA